jgi:NAD+ kinase
MKKAKIIINLKKIRSREALRAAKSLLIQHGFKITSDPDFIVAMGGDGTILAAANIYGRKGVPILGLNIGGLGFLTDIGFREFSAVLRSIRKNKYRIEKRMVLKAQLGKRSLYALNDLIICTRVPGRSVEFTALINGEYISRYVADGIIVATPTGSTAYSLAGGGPILLPDTEAIVLNAIAPHTLSVRPLILPPLSRVEIQIGKKGKSVLVADGQRSIAMRAGQVIRFEKAGYHVKLLKTGRTTFIKTLREKLKWGGREDA